MSSIVRMGFIGGGRALQEIHLPIFTAMKEVLPLVLCDVRESVLQDALRKFGVRETTAHWEDVLAMREVDAVVIALPNDLHARVAEQALRAGKHVLCELPSALRASDAEAVVRAARDSGCLYALTLPHRYDPALLHLRRTIEADRLGRILHVRATLLRRNARPDGWPIEAERSGGGVFVHFGTRLLDQVSQIIDDAPVTRVSAVMSSCGGASAIEDEATVLMRFADGRSALIETAWSRDVEEERQSLEVTGTRGSARLWPLRIMSALDGVPAMITPQCPSSPSSTELAQHFVTQVQRCRRGEPGVRLSANAIEGLRLTVLTQHVYESAAKGREIDIDLAPLAAFTKGA